MNGKTYDSMEDLPSDLCEAYEKALTAAPAGAKISRHRRGNSSLAGPPVTHVAMLLTLAWTPAAVNFYEHRY